MYLADITAALLELLRTRMRNGEMTERSLARQLGVSQPHIHNVIKGARAMSPDLLDRLLQHLHLSVLDLVDLPTLRRYVEANRPSTEFAWLPVLAGAIGPGDPWPVAVEAHRRFRIPETLLREMWEPVVARAGEDPAMHPLFGAGDIVVLDQSARGRQQMEDNGLYLLRHGTRGILRRLRLRDGSVWAVAEADLTEPDRWERLSVQGPELLHAVRARAWLIGPMDSWSAGTGETQE